MSAVLGDAILGDLVLATADGAKLLTASETITFLQLGAYQQPFQQASEHLSFNELGQSQFLPGSSPGGQAINFAQSASVQLVRDFSGCSTLANPESKLGVNFMLGLSCIIANFGIATNTIQFTDTADAVFDDLAIGVAQSILWADLAEVNLKQPQANHTLEFTQDAAATASNENRQTVTFSQLASAGKVTCVTAIDQIVWRQAPRPQLIRDQIKEYAPETSRAEFQPPNLVKQSEISFDYDGLLLTLKTPETDNKFRNISHRVRRESLGGEAIVYRSANWVDREVLLIDVTNIKEERHDEILDFMEASLGHELIFTDWESREWKGVILNPDESIVRNNRDHFDLTVEFEGVLQ